MRYIVIKMDDLDYNKLDRQMKRIGEKAEKLISETLSKNDNLSDLNITIRKKDVELLQYIELDKFLKRENKRLFGDEDYDGDGWL